MDPNRFRCAHCQKQPFSSQGKLNRHLKSHTKPYKCELCGKGFGSRPDLTRHAESRHRVGQQRLRCSFHECRFSTIRRDNLRSHVRNVHQNARETIAHPITVSIGHGIPIEPTGNKQSAESHNGFGLRSSNHLPILQAASAGDLGLFEYSQALGLDLSLKADDGSTLLHCASRAGQPAAVRHLLDLGLSLEEKNDKERTPLHEAVLSGNLETVDICLKADPDGEILNRGHEPALHLAARLGHAPIVAALLSQPQIKVNCQLALEVGYSPLHLAAKYGRKDVVQELLSHKAIDVNISMSRSNSLRTTPLHLAARYGHEDIVRLLLARDDIDVDQVSGRFWTAVDEAVCNGHPSIAHMILEDPRHGSKQFKHYMTILNLQRSFLQAIKQGYIDVARLLSHDALVDINRKPYNSDSDFNALGQAVFSGNLEMIRMLLQHRKINVNCDITRYFAKGTALHVAAKFGRVHATGLLLQHKDIDPNTKTNDGRLALHDALLHDHVGVAKLLLQHPRTDVNARARVTYMSEDEKQALDIARERGQTEIVHMLLHRVDTSICEPKNSTSAGFNEHMNLDTSQSSSAEQLLDGLEWTREHE